MQDPNASSQPSEAAATTTDQVSIFKEQLAKAVGADRTSKKVQQIEEMVNTLVERALGDTKIVSDDTFATINAMIRKIDDFLTSQVNEIIHHEEFQELEGAWRGLHHLVNNTDTGEMMKIKVLNISKRELGKSLDQFKGTAWDVSPMFKKVYDSEYGSPGGIPFGCLVGDFHFDESAEDVDLLREMANICAVAHAPFITGAKSSVCGLKSWLDLSGPRDLSKIFETDNYAPWRSLREAEESRYIGLTLPRVLARLPYGAKTRPVEEFNFEEDTGAGDHSKYTWANSAYAMAVNVNRSFSAYGWCTQIRGPEAGGQVLGLPCHTFPTDDGNVEMKCPTEIAITNRRENELANLGFMPLQHIKGTDTGAFVGAQSLQKPFAYTDSDATANANLAARLPYLFACCRFSHYLNLMAWRKIGSSESRAQLERWLNDWIIDYVCDTNTSSVEQKARRPLAKAEITVEDVEGNPGEYKVTCQLLPHYQVEKMTIAMNLVSKLKSEKA